MDPISQGVVGALCAHPVAPKRRWPSCALAAWLSGMAPDLDVLVRSAEQPLLALVYHRHFTHSLAFIPFGGLLCAALCYWIFLRRLDVSWRTSYIVCTLGYASHGLLDSCTSYGTQLLWPFSDARIAWDLISIIDPLFTLPLLIFFALSLRVRWRRYATYALIFMLSYLGLAGMQHARVLDAAQKLATQRGHKATMLSVRPTLGNIVLWRSTYLSGEVWHIDAIRAGSSVQITPGEQIQRFDSAAMQAALPPASALRDDVRVFSWFTQGYLGHASHDPSLIFDIRYAMLPQSAQGIWGIYLDPSQHAQHISLQTFRDMDVQHRKQFFDMLLGRTVE